MDPACSSCLCALRPRAAGGARLPCLTCRRRRGVFGRASAMAGPPGAPPTQRSAPRPKAPQVELSRAEVNVTFSGRDEPTPDPDLPLVHGEGPVSSQPEPISLRDVEVMSSPMREVTASRRLFDLVDLSDGPDGEPVSLSDLQAIFSPGHNPSPRLGSLAPAPVAPVAAGPAPPSAEIEGTTAKLPPVALRRVTFDEEPEGAAPPLLLEKRQARAFEVPRRKPAQEVPISSDASQPISSDALQPISSDGYQPISSGSFQPISSEPSQPISSGSILASSEPEMDVDFSGIDETRPSPGVEKSEEKADPKKRAHLPFFDLGSFPPLGAPDLYEAAPAPFDPSVPPLPPAARVSDAPNSGLKDIRALALEAGMSEPVRRSDFDLFNLSGGIFDESHGNLGPPDLHLLAQPTARTLRPSRPSGAPVSQRPIAPVLTPSSAPVVSERAPRPAAGTTRRGPRAALIAGIAALIALGAVGVDRLRTRSADRPDPGPIGAETASLPTLTAAAPPPTAPSPPIAAEVAAIDPLARPEKSSPAALTASAPKPAPSLTTLTTPSREPVADKAPAPEKTAAVEKPLPTVVEIPPPSGGAEFDKAAAKAALSSAASRAAGCKPGDDPGGGAKVSVTFAPSGRVTTSRVTGAPYQGTTIGGCIAAAFRSASVPPFEGAPVTVSKDVSLH